MASSRGMMDVRLTKYWSWHTVTEVNFENGGSITFGKPTDSREIVKGIDNPDCFEYGDYVEYNIETGEFYVE